MPTTLKRGDTVVIPKGTVLWNMLKGRSNPYRAKRTYRVRIHDTHEAFTHEETTTPARVIWAGTGGYWTYANLADVQIPSVETEPAK